MNTEIECIEPHTDAWNAARCGRLTSSEVHRLFVKGRSKDKIFGEGAMTYIFEKIAENLTKEIKKTPETEAILRGLTEEIYARQRYIELTGHITTESCFIPYNIIFGGTNDGNIIIDGKVKGIIEIKCPDSKKFVEICTCLSGEELKQVDKQYYHQCQANMLIADAEFADFVAYDDRVKIRECQIKIIRIYPDMEWRKEFTYLLGEVANIMNEAITKILNVHEINLQFKADKIDPQKLSELSETIKNIKLED